MVKDVKTIDTTMDKQQSMQALSQYGGYIISVILLVLAGYFGWNYWQKHGGRIDTAAANDFAKIQTDQNNLETLSNQSASDANAQKQLATAQANMDKDLASFIATHDNSVYTWQALMLQARQQTDKNDFKAASAALKKATELNIKDEGLKAIATIRYAQALLADNQVDAAQKVLQTNLPSAFEASKQELLGDIAMQKNDKNTAITAYQKAWQLVETRNNNNEIKQDRALLRLKMENLGLSAKQPDLTGGLITNENTNQGSIASIPRQTVQASASSN